MDEERSLAYQAQQAARWAESALIQAGPAKDGREARQNALVWAQMAAAFASRDLADAQRELARSNDRLALTWDALAEEMVRRRNVRAAT
jgi:hypothetical protein